MVYHPLTNDTGQTPERRREEAEDIMAMLSKVSEQLTEREAEFIAGMEERDWCSPQQLFWLRDLKEKYL